MSSYSDKLITESITTITGFAQRVDTAITKLRTDLDKNYDQHTDIYKKISYIQGVNEEISEKINKFESHNSETINAEKNNKYGDLEPSIMKWYEDTYYIYDEPTKTLSIE